VDGDFDHAVDPPVRRIADDAMAFPDRVPDKAVRVDAGAVRHARTGGFGDRSPAASRARGGVVPNASIWPRSLSANPIVRPSGEKQVPFAQTTPSNRRVAERSGSSR
jgi:hypothetical protein